MPVLGCALSARAACELRDQAGIDAPTISRLTRGFDGGVGLSPGAVLIVDEAGMVGTRSLAKLADAVEVADGKLVLVGDDRQLPEIEAGGLFAVLADQRVRPRLRRAVSRVEGRRGTLPRVKLGRHVRYIRSHVEATILHAEEGVVGPRPR